MTGSFDDEGFADAKKGKCVFPFSFRIPEDAPTSYKFGKVGKLIYVVSGVVSYKYQGVLCTLFSSRYEILIDH